MLSNSIQPLKGAKGKRSILAAPRNLNLLVVLVMLMSAFFTVAAQQTAFAEPLPNYTLTLTGPDTAQPGSNITYQASIIPDSSYMDFTVNDYTPYGTDFVSATQVSGAGNFSCVNQSGNIVCTPTTAITQSQEIKFNFVFKVRTDVSPGYYIYNDFNVALTGFPYTYYSDGVETHVPSNTTISIQGPAQVLPGDIVTYKLVIKNSGTAAVSNVQVENVFPAELAYISGDLGNCTNEPLSIQGVKTSGMANPNTVYCNVENLGAGDTRVITLNFASFGEIGQCFENDASIYVYNQPTYVPAEAKPNARSGDTDSASITTCFAEKPVQNISEPAADLAAQLRVSSSLDVLGENSSDISYTLTVKNNGYGPARRIQVTFPFDPNLTVGYATFDTTGPWVSAVNAGSVVIEFPDLDYNQSMNATLVMHPSATATAGTTEFNRFSVRWDDSQGTGKVGNSNGVRYNLSNATENQQDGDVQLFNPATVTLTNGQQQTFSGDFFAPGELVSAWYTDQNGASISLGTTLAGPNGEISISLTPTSLVAGQQYVLAAYGNKSEVYGSSVITIGS